MGLMRLQGFMLFLMPFKVSEKVSDLKERGHRHKEESIAY